MSGTGWRYPVDWTCVEVLKSKGATAGEHSPTSNRDFPQCLPCGCVRTHNTEGASMIKAEGALLALWCAVLFASDPVKGEPLPDCGTDAIISQRQERQAKAETAESSSYTIDDRLKDCATLPGSETYMNSVRWNLVARQKNNKTSRYYEVWQDSRTGYLWGDLLDKKYIQEDAIMFSGGMAVKQLACNSELGIRANIVTDGTQFHVPTPAEYVEAERGGISAILPNMKGNSFLTSTPGTYKLNTVFKPDVGRLDTGFQLASYSIRCVSSSYVKRRPEPTPFAS